jgi:hypothetical protein
VAAGKLSVDLDVDPAVDWPAKNMVIRLSVRCAVTVIVLPIGRVPKMITRESSAMTQGYEVARHSRWVS